MKKPWSKIVLLFFCLSIFFFSKHIFHQWKRVQKEYRNKETYLKYLKKEDFLNAIRKSPPSWMLDQITEDFQLYRKNGIPQKNINATFSQIQKTLGATSFLVRYRILHGKLYRYFPENEDISLEDNSTERAMKTLLYCTSLPDLDIIISFCDGIFPSDRYYLTQNEEEQAPILCSAKIQGMHHVILFPDWRSIGQWWIADSKTMLTKKDLFPWEKKKEKALWRGGLTNPRRLDLCRLSLQFPDDLDAKIVPGKDQKIDENLIGERVSWEEFLQCKYLPYMDGVMCAAPALQWRLLSQSLTFKPTSNEIQWFYRALLPFVHYIPVKTDLSDFMEKLNWARAHDKECQQIANQAYRFAKENLLHPEVLLYFYHLLKTYGSMQTIDPKETEQEMIRDARWVKIHERVSLRKKAVCHQMKGYVTQATPY